MQLCNTNRNSKKGFGLIVSCVVSCQVRTLRAVEKSSNGNYSSIWKFSSIWYVYVAVIHTCFEACTYQPRLPVLCKPQGDWKVPVHLLEFMMEITVNEWVPGAFVLEVKFEFADWAVTCGTIPVHTWLSHFQHIVVPFLYRCRGTSHSHYNVRFVLSEFEKYCHVS